MIEHQGQSDSLVAIYRNAFEASSQGFCLLEKGPTPPSAPTRFSYLLTNHAFELLLGLQETVGTTIQQATDQLQAHCLDDYDRVALTGQPIHFEHYVAVLDLWMAVDVFRVKHQEPYWIGVLFENITQRKKVEKQQAYLLTLSDALRPLADAKQIQEVALHCLGSHLQVDRVLYAEVEPDQAHFVIAANYVRHNFPQMIGRFRLSDFGKTPHSQRLGQTLVIADINQADEADEHLRSYLAAGVVSIIGIPLRKEGRWVASLTVHHGLPRQWTAQEVTLVEETAERTWAALERARAEQALSEANRHKEEFMAMLAHELRNPLATIYNTLLVLSLTHGQEEVLPLDRALAMMSREVTHLNQMVDGLLDVSRISQGKIQLKKQRLELSRLIREALEATRSQFASRGQTLTVHLPNEPIWVNGDHTRLTQVVHNLATNAAKYTPNGGQIRIKLDKEDSQAVLRVQDSGIGIGAEQLEAIFEVFVQVASSLDRPQGGLGLGLAVVKQLVDLHGGQVRADSPGLGQGSEFTVRLPLIPNAPASRPSTKIGKGNSRKAGRILVVDDNADLALTTAMLLRVSNYETDTCLSGWEALKIVASSQPDAVLLDLGMPGMDGYETCRRLREMDWGRQGTIVALSGYGQEEDKKRTQQAGFNGHLVKPADLQTLTALLDKLLNRTESEK